jgi:type I restriction enzyme S subunit
MNNAYLSDIFICTPTSEEQEAITDFLDTKCIEIDALVSEKQRAAKTMRQYKRSLIYEYVTGKKRVTVGGVPQ